jgi:hypothetical protein
MLIKQFALIQSGKVNGLYGLLTPDFSVFDCAPGGDEYYGRVAKEIIEFLRDDHEKRTYGNGVPDENPSLGVEVVNFYYTPTLEKKKLYSKGFPVVQDTYDILDAFVCLGSRFGLEARQVIVEVCSSRMGDRRVWANIYYVVDSVLPVSVICSQELDVSLNDEFIERGQERNKKFLEHAASVR